jgi:hypothetical protein
MKWPLAIILLGLFIAGGCQSQPPVCDPFFGRTTIPPPPTGSLGGRAADPCYQPPPLGPSPVATPASPCSPPQVQLPAPQSNPCLPMQPSVQAPSNLGPPQVQLPSQPMGQALGNPPPVGAQPLGPPSLAPAITTPQPAAPPRAVPGYAAPRPLSTEPGGSSVPRPSYPASPPGAGSFSPPPAASPAPPSGTSPYMPPDGSFNYRGSSTQRSTSPAAASAEARLGTPSFTNVAIAQTSSAGDDRAPRPVDDSVAAGSLSGRKPIVRTLQPRAKDETSDRAVDIVDLPKNPASAP